MILHPGSTAATTNDSFISREAWELADAAPGAVEENVLVNKRIDSLQSLRLVASLAVFQSHLWTNYLGASFTHPGTDFFLVLVGMVAALTDAGRIARGDWKRYILQRYLRLYVTFIPVFLLYVIAGRDELTPGYLVRSFFFIPSNGQMPLVGPTWMLAMFLAFYWAFSTVFLFRRESVLLPIFGVWGVGCLLVTGLDLHFPVFDKALQMLFSIRCLEFFAGYAAGWLVRRRYVTGMLGGRLLATGALLLLASVLFLNLSRYGEEMPVRVMLYGSSMTLIASGLAAQERDGRVNACLRALTHPWLVGLGGASYVLYLTHNMLLRIWDTLLPLTAWQAPLATAVIVAVAALGYQVWEKPLLAFVRRRWLGGSG